MSNYTPGIPPLSGIKDADTRRVLEALVNGWRTRNGETKPDSDQRFVTKGELADLARDAAVQYVASAQGARAITDAMGGDTGSDFADRIRRDIADLQQSVMNSPLWHHLGERVRLIDFNQVKEQQARIAQAQALADALQATADELQQVADDLAAEAATRLGFDGVIGSRVGTLETVTDDQAELITGLTTRTANAESTIIGLQSTTVAQATSLSSLTTRVGTAESKVTSLQTTTANQATSLNTLNTEVGTAKSNITSLQTTTASQASSLNTLTSRVGTAESKVTSLETTSSSQASTLNSLSTRVGSTESSISTLNTTTASQANSLSALQTRVGTTESAIVAEQTTRANADNAITNSVTTQFSTVNNNISGIQTAQSTLSNSISAVANRVDTLQVTVGNNTTAIGLEADARVSADGAINSRYSVKIDTNGYVTGYGLISTANVQENPTSEFLVRADRFAVGSASVPNYVGYVDKYADLKSAWLTAGSPNKLQFGYNHWVASGQAEGRVLPVNDGVVPFVVTTTPSTRSDGSIRPPGVFMDSATVNKLDGAEITAGLLTAVKLYSGSQYVDFDSKLNIPAAGYGSYADTWTDTTSPLFSAALRFYGPGYHSGVPYYQRVRKATATNQVAFTITACATVDHYMSIWYRINGGGWIWIAKVVEPQNGDGMAALSTTILLDIGLATFVDFGASGSNESNVFINSAKKYLKDATVTVQTVNL